MIGAVPETVTVSSTPADLQGHDQRGGRCCTHLHPGIDEDAEARQADAHLVGADRQPQQARLALHVREDVGAVLRPP